MSEPKLMSDSLEREVRELVRQVAVRAMVARTLVGKDIDLQMRSIQQLMEEFTPLFMTVIKRTTPQPVIDVRHSEPSTRLDVQGVEGGKATLPVLIKNPETNQRWTTEDLDRAEIGIKKMKSEAEDKATIEIMIPSEWWGVTK